MLGQHIKLSAFNVLSQHYTLALHQTFKNNNNYGINVKHYKILNPLCKTHFNVIQSKILLILGQCLKNLLLEFNQ